MPHIKSLVHLQNLRKKVGVIRCKVESYASATPAYNLQQAPQPGKWNALQCLEHLNSYGRVYLPAIEQAIEKAEAANLHAQPNFKSGILGAWFTNMMEPKADGSISKMQAPKDHRPSASLDANSVVNEFLEQQDKMEVLLQRAEKINIQKIKIPTSLSRFIKLSLGDTFGFLIAHIRRHVLQAEKAIGVATPYESVAK
ncbi:DinB family protein [Chitinophaga silvatica]|uniref:DinB family protein n=1 Tax=Chitinophaga silvatica TaxID=2282649 RepID=A0A3E1Y9R0_9BACT|nr:DinB family protein [Chitinophaga silvatica]RFS22440.1 DinB family protein [Chitinophaga silvatica]